jgi:hypothetical protein
VRAGVASVMVLVVVAFVAAGETGGGVCVRSVCGGLVMVVFLAIVSS